LPINTANERNNKKRKKNDNKQLLSERMEQRFKPGYTDENTPVQIRNISEQLPAVFVKKF